MSNLNWGPTPAGWGAQPVYTPPPPPPPKKSNAGKIILIVLAVVVILVILVGAVLAAVFALGDANGSSGTLTGEWKRRSSPAGAFTLELPEGVRSDTLSSELPDGTNVTIPTLTLYTGSGEDFGLVSFEMDYGAEGLADAVSIRGAAEGTIVGMGGAVDSFLPASTPLGDAALVTGHVDRVDAQVRGYVLAQGLRLLWIAVVVPNGDEKIADESLQRAVASLQPA